jgi:hypothetical protein
MGHDDDARTVLMEKSACPAAPAAQGRKIRLRRAVLAAE